MSISYNNKLVAIPFVQKALVRNNVEGNNNEQTWFTLIENYPVPSVHPNHPLRTNDVKRRKNSESFLSCLFNKRKDEEDDVHSKHALQSDEVLIKVKCSCIHNYQIEQCPQGICGMDFSGVIIKKGDSVKNFKVEEEVIGIATPPMGSCQEYIVINTSKPFFLIKKPSAISFEAASLFPSLLITLFNCFQTPSGMDDDKEENEINSLSDNVILLTGISKRKETSNYWLAKLSCLVLKYFYFCKRVYIKFSEKEEQDEVFKNELKRVGCDGDFNAYKSFIQNQQNCKVILLDFSCGKHGLDEVREVTKNLKSIVNIDFNETSQHSITPDETINNSRMKHRSRRASFKDWMGYVFGCNEPSNLKTILNEKNMKDGNSTCKERYITFGDYSARGEILNSKLKAVINWLAGEVQFIKFFEEGLPLLSFDQFVSLVRERNYKPSELNIVKIDQYKEEERNEEKTTQTTKQQRTIELNTQGTLLSRRKSYNSFNAENTSQQPVMSVQTGKRQRMTKEDVKIGVDEQHNVLTVSGEVKKEKKEENERYHCVERSVGSFSRSVQLPKNIDLDGIKANLEHGVLRVTVPKKVDETKKRTINID
ncbi:hypothetical protein ABK040_016230 [Willaertia magna]